MRVCVAKERERLRGLILFLKYSSAYVQTTNSPSFFIGIGSSKRNTRARAKIASREETRRAGRYFRGRVYHMLKKVPLVVYM